MNANMNVLHVAGHRWEGLDSKSYILENCINKKPSWDDAARRNVVGLTITDDASAYDGLDDQVDRSACQQKTLNIHSHVHRSSISSSYGLAGVVQ